RWQRSLGEDRSVMGPDRSDVDSRRGSGGRRLLGLAAWLTTPLLPEDYLALVDPLWSPRGLRARVEEVRPETDGAATVVLRPGRGWVDHRAGQYVQVGVDVDGVRHWRAFSLSSPPGRPDKCVAITVKAEPHGVVSPYLVRRIRTGAIVRLTPAAGDFVVPEEVPGRLLFLTAGSGVTPVAAILRDLDARRELPDTVLVHSAPTRDHVIFGHELRALAARSTGLRLHERY